MTKTVLVAVDSGQFDLQEHVDELKLLSLLIRQEPDRDARSGLEMLGRAKLNKFSPQSEELQHQLKNIWKNYQAKLRSLPGDLFFLNEVGPDRSGGFIVYLRRVAELSPEAIAIRPLERNARLATRISRLRPPFRYRLTQQLAAMFADIGLPREYEHRTVATVANLAAILQIDLP